MLKKKKKLINLSLTRALLPTARELPYPKDSVNWRLEPDNKHGSGVAIGRNTIRTLCVPSRRCCTMAHYNRWAPGTLRGKELKGGKSNFHMGTFWNSVVASDPCLFSTHSPQWLWVSAQLSQPLFVSMQTCSLGVVLPGIINVNERISQRLRCSR